MSRKNLLFIIIGVIVLLFIVLIILGIKRNTTKKLPYNPANLTVWGVYDDSTVYDPIISDFENQYPGINVTYRKFDYSTYESSLLNALAAGNGPDIFMVNNLEMPQYLNKIATAPANLISLASYNSTFPKVVSNDFVHNGQIYGVPLYVDTMALYYNTDLFNSAGIATPPATWDEFNQDAQKLTHLDQFGNISQSGAAIGTSSNIDRSFDILSLLMMQSGANMYDQTSKQATFDQGVGSGHPGETALAYYTDFANPANQDYTWNNSMPYSVDAFIEGKTAMIFDYSYMISELKTQAPYLNFNVAPMPQIANSRSVTNIANYWGYAVAKTSKNKLDAWLFLSFLESDNEMKKYLTATQEPTPMIDLYNWQLSDSSFSSMLDVFVKQTLTASDWHQPNTNDVNRIFSDMINNVNLGKSTVRDAISNAASLVTNLR